MRAAWIQAEICDGETAQKRKEKAGQSIEELLCRTKGEEPDLILLPELWPCGFFDFASYRKSAEETPEYMDWLRETAKRFGIWIVTGSMIEKEDGKYYNTCRILDREGREAGKYRKIHLFGYESEEKKCLSQGEEAVVVQTEWGKAGLATCYDLRFPEQFRRMAEEGASCFFVVSAWPSARLFHWRLFNQVRALENQCFLVSCNSAGTQLGTEYAGHSMAVGPDGTILAEAGKEPGVGRAVLDWNEVKRYRESFPAWEDRKSWS